MLSIGNSGSVRWFIIFDCYLITEYSFSPQSLKQNISVNSETSFFAWFQVPILHKSESEEPPPKISRKSICGFPSKAAGCSCIFKEKEQKGKRMHQGKRLQGAPGWAAYSLSFPASSLISLCLWLSSFFIIDFMRILVAQGRSGEKTALEIVLPWHALK